MHKEMLQTVSRFAGVSETVLLYGNATLVVMGATLGSFF